MYLIFKIIGSAMIIGGSSLIGIVIANSFSKRVSELRDIKTFLTICETSMSDIGMHVEDILLSSQQYLKTVIKKIIKNIYNDMQTEYPDLFFNMWKEQIKSQSSLLSLKKQELDAFIRVGNFLGGSGLDNQKKQIKHIENIIEKNIAEAITERNKNRKIAINLGILGGFLISLLII